MFVVLAGEARTPIAITTCCSRGLRCRHRRHGRSGAGKLCNVAVRRVGALGLTNFLRICIVQLCKVLEGQVDKMRAR